LDVTLVLMSFAVGLLIGLTSMGGAALMAPFLILAVGVRPSVAVQTDLVYGAITKIMAAGVHWSQHTVDSAIALRMAAGSIPGGLLGSVLVYTMPRFGVDVELYTKRAVGVALVLVALVLLVRLFGCVYRIRPGRRLDWLQGGGTVTWGALVGFCVGLTSVGSGSLIAPFLLLVFPLSAAKVVGTDVFHAAILVGVTGLTHAIAAPVDWPMVSNLLLGAIPGAIIGSHLVPRIPAKILRGGMAVVLLATGVKMV
jgi:uncharacterized membrane protein YfcA